jgi:homoprotocatechuate degradation regulator HpaR
MRKCCSPFQQGRRITVRRPFFLYRRVKRSSMDFTKNPVNNRHHAQPLSDRTDMKNRRMPSYRDSLSGTLLATRELVMAPIRGELRSAGLTEQQWRVLRVLADDGPTDSSRLAEKALLLAPSVTRIMRDLISRNLIVRQADPSDARRSILTITPAGRKLIIRAADHAFEIIDAYRAAFGSERLDTLISDLREFMTAIEPISRRYASADYTA